MKANCKRTEQCEHGLNLRAHEFTQRWNNETILLYIAINIQTMYSSIFPLSLYAVKFKENDTVKGENYWGNSLFSPKRHL